MRRGPLACLLIVVLGSCCLLVGGAVAYYVYYFSTNSTASRPDEGGGPAGTVPTAFPDGSLQVCRDAGDTSTRRAGRWLADAGAIVNDIGYFAATGNRRDTQFASGDGAITAALTMDFPRDVTAEPAQFVLRVYQPEGKIVACRLAIIPKAGTAVYRVEIPRASPISAEKGRWRVEIVSDDTPLGSADFERR